MKGELAKSIKTLIKDPASNINSLNQILPALIKSFQEGQTQEVVNHLSTIMQAFVNK